MSVYNPKDGWLVRLWQDEGMRLLTDTSWSLFPKGGVPDTRSRWRKLLDRMNAETIGRFRAWLHRDCGDY